MSINTFKVNLNSLNVLSIFFGKIRRFYVKVDDNFVVLLKT